MSKNVLDHEPHLALFVNSHIMEFYQAIADFIMKYQDVGCIIATEINESHGDEVIQVFTDAGLKDIYLQQDLQGKDRIVLAHK
jgi:release factor glutamine methyltransferase